jgi:hypothetical protein
MHQKLFRSYYERHVITRVVLRNMCYSRVEIENNYMA